MLVFRCSVRPQGLPKRCQRFLPSTQFEPTDAATIFYCGWRMARTIRARRSSNKIIVKNLQLELPLLLLLLQRQQRVRREGWSAGCLYRYCVWACCQLRSPVKSVNFGIFSLRRGFSPFRFSVDFKNRNGGEGKPLQ